MKTQHNKSDLSQSQQWGLIILRIILGWYLLYEGISKLIQPDWSAEYLLMSSRILSNAFQWMASNNAALEIMTFLNVWGLIFIGLGLLSGILTRIAVYMGILMLLLYYVAFLPLEKFTFGISTEGNYLLFDKTFLVMLSLVTLSLFPRTLNFGLGKILKSINIRGLIPSNLLRQKTELEISDSNKSNSRRDLLKNLAFLPFIGGFIGVFMGNRKFINELGTDAITGATITLDQLSLSELEGEIPQGKLGTRSVSRLISGSNLIGGWAHARDLRYSHQLFKAYNTVNKVFETLLISEKAGINTINLVSSQLPLIKSYKKLYGDNGLQTMVQVGAGGGHESMSQRVIEDIDRSIDLGADFIQIWGAAGDILARDGQIDELHKCIEHAQKQGYPTGLGAHDIHTLLAYDRIGIEPDFYFKTLHHDKYRTAIPKEDRAPYQIFDPASDNNPYYDNMWCLFPEKTIDYFQKIKKPVIAFKVLAAGAISPEDGFQYAFDNGADFICVGMFDFQVVEDANIAIRAIEKAKNRKRQWYG